MPFDLEEESEDLEETEDLGEPEEPEKGLSGEDYEHIARRVAAMMGPGRQGQQPSRQQQARIETVMRDLHARGVKPESMQVVLDLVHAAQSDMLAEQEVRKRHESAQSDAMAFERACWREADAVISNFEEGFPFLSTSRELRHVVLGDVAKIMGSEAFLKKHPGLLENVQQGMIPSKAAFRAAATQAIEKLGKQLGVEKKPGGTPLNLRNSKPAKEEDSLESANPRDGMSGSERRLYNAVLSSTKDKNLALKAVKNMRG